MNLNRPEPAPPVQAPPVLESKNMFNRHRVWWFTLVIACLLFVLILPGKPNDHDIRWAYALGGVVGLFLVGFTFGGLAYLFSIMIGRRMTSRQFMSVFTVAVMLAMTANVLVTSYDDVIVKRTASNVTQLQKQIEDSLQNLSVFDLSLKVDPDVLRNDGTLTVSGIQGRVRNASGKLLSSFILKIVIVGKDGVTLDTEHVTIIVGALPPGDVKSFSGDVYIQRVPKDFSWNYKLTYGEFH